MKVLPADFEDEERAMSHEMRAAPGAGKDRKWIVLQGLVTPTLDPWPPES